MRSARTFLAVALALLVLMTGAIGVMGTVTAQDETTDCSFPLTVTDATGENVTIVKAPEKVVTLAPSASQTMWEIGAQDKVVGISSYGTYLDWEDEKKVISGKEGFMSTEEVIAQEPDLVLAPDIISDDKVDQLRETEEFAVYNFEGATSMDDVVEKTRLIGQLTGSCEGANARAEEMEQSLEIVRTAIEGEERPEVLYLLGGQFTAGEETFINDVIEAAGGSNIGAKVGTGYAKINPEVVANESPEYIIVSDGAPEVIPDIEAYNNTDAVQNDQIIEINANYLNQPAPRTIQIVEDFASEWHPDAYESAKESFAEEATTAPSEDMADETTAGATETESPGLGPILALIAVIGAVLVARTSRS